MHLTIIIPTLNEEEGIEHTIQMINKRELSRRGFDLETLVIDGGSEDRTVEVARELGARVVVEKRKGYGRAYKTGFAAARDGIICTADADGTYPLEKLHIFVDYLMENKLDFITINRFPKMATRMKSSHRLGNRVLTFVMRLLFWIKIKDSQSGMWIFRKDILNWIQPLEKFHNSMPFSEEIKIEVFKRKKIKAEEIPGTYYPRKGKEKMKFWRDGLRDLGFLFIKRLTFRKKIK